MNRDMNDSMIFFYPKGNAVEKGVHITYTTWVLWIRNFNFYGDCDSIII